LLIKLLASSALAIRVRPNFGVLASGGASRDVKASTCVNKFRS
jgi:hypothetical protein